MAQKVQVDNVSDLSGAPADETVKFALDGTDYEIDLDQEEAAGMRDVLAPWIVHARSKPGARARKARRGRRADLPDIRVYAQARGHKINERGRVPERIIAEYDLLKDLKVIP
jgi:hypothetical protein